MRERTGAVALAAAIFAIFAGVYTATHSFRGITDTRLNSLQTRALVLHGDIDLTRYGVDPEDFQTSDAKLVVERDGRLYSVYGVGVSLVSSPIYAITARTGMSDSTAQAMVAILFAAGSASLLALLLIRLTTLPVAALSLIVFAFGTTLWPVASMAFFQQGPVLFFECLGLLGLFARRPRPALAGFGFGTAALIRPTAAILLAIVGLFYLVRGWRRLGAYVVGAVLPLVAHGVQNRWIWGSWIEGGYSHAGVTFGAPFGEAFGGLTIGWWRGLLVYSPFVAFGIVGWLLSLRRDGEIERALSFLGISALLTLLVYSKWADWGGGINQFGYRLQLDFVPGLIVLGAYALTRVPKLLGAAAATALVSVLTMTWGAAPSRDGFDDVLFAHRIKQSSLWRAWESFLDQPVDGVMRLALVVVASALIVAIADRLRRGSRAEPLFVGAELDPSHP